MKVFQYALINIAADAAKHQAVRKDALEAIGSPACKHINQLRTLIADAEMREQECAEAFKYVQGLEKLGWSNLYRDEKAQVRKYAKV